MPTPNWLFIHHPTHFSIGWLLTSFCFRLMDMIDSIASFNNQFAHMIEPETTWKRNLTRIWEICQVKGGGTCLSTLEQKLFVVMVLGGCCITKTKEEIWLGHHWFSPKREGKLFCNSKSKNYHRQTTISLINKDPIQRSLLKGKNTNQKTEPSSPFWKGNYLLPCHWLSSFSLFEFLPPQFCLKFIPQSMNMGTTTGDNIVSPIH